MGWIARLPGAAGALLLVISLPAAAVDLFNNTNTGGVLNGATGQPTFMTPTAVHVTQIVTYHWNNGSGARPGTITLRSLGGPAYGPFNASGTSGQGNAPNVNWIADVNLQLPAGTYQVFDSDPRTWSQNAQSSGIGFAIIRGERVTGAAPPTPTPPTAAPPGRLPPPPKGGTAPTVAPAAKFVPSSAPSPGGPMVDLFNNTNTDAVQNQPKSNAAVLLMAVGGTHVAQLQTYHWNNARGAKPGTLTLKSLSGPTYGPFPARGVAGSNNVPNANWVADVSIDLTLGTYQLIDSDPATWSQNEKSRGVGFAIIRGMRSFPAGGTPSAAKPGAPAGAGASGGTFTPCMTNAGSIASMAPCAGAPGTRITFKLSRAIAHPIKSITFKPYSVTGIAGGTGAQVLAPVSGNAIAAGSYYEVTVPAQLCVGGGGTWDLFPFDTSGQGQGDIGRFAVDCRPGAAVGGGGAPAPSTTPPPVAPTPAAFKPCFVNSGSVAQVSPCTVHVGDIITVRLTQALKSPVATVTFKPYQVGLPGGVAAQVMVKMTTTGAAAGTNYNFATDPKLCLGGTGSWDVWPFDAAGKGLGDIGRVNVICR